MNKTTLDQFKANVRQFNEDYGVMATFSEKIDCEGEE